MGLRLICELCDGRLVTGHDAAEVHVLMHRLIDEPCQVWWVVADGLVLRRAQDEQR